MTPARNQAKEPAADSIGPGFFVFSFLRLAFSCCFYLGRPLGRHADMPTLHRSREH
jgi:hypothetical protein